MNSTNSNIETWDLLAEVYHNLFASFTLYDDTYDLFLQELSTENAKILELGCGPGNITNYLLTRNNQLRILGTDSSPRMIEIAQRNVPEAEFNTMDCRDLKHINSNFDGIVCGFCIPYLSIGECRKLLHDIFKLLNSDGVLYLSCIEGRAEKSGFERDSQGNNKMYVNYYEAEKLKTDLIRLGYQNCKVIQKNYTRKNGIEEVHSVIIARK